MGWLCGRLGAAGVNVSFSSQITRIASRMGIRLAAMVSFIIKRLFHILRRSFSPFTRQTLDFPQTELRFFFKRRTELTFLVLFKLLR
jgi:hypothetical protein